MRKIFTRLFAMILLLGVLLPMLPVTADAAEESSITLRQPGSGTVVPFAVSNLFPNQSVTREYEVKTKHPEAITLNFRADIRKDAQYQKLAEVLKVRIEIQNESNPHYDGLMKDMPAALQHSLPAGTNRVTYRITVYLDASVGNDYMDKSLVADFFWWFEDTSDVAVKLTAEKLMDGNYARGKKFSFVLEDHTGKTVSTAKNDDGHIEFDTLYFSAPGTYTYTISEREGSNPEIRYDPAVYKAVITIREDESYTVAYFRNGSEYSGLPRFLNRTKGAPGSQEPSDDPSDYDPDNPKTGDDFPLLLAGVICGSALCLLICLLLLWKNPKKEEKNHV